MKDKTSIYGLHIKSFCEVCNKEIHVGDIYRDPVPEDSRFGVLDRFREAYIKHMANDECGDKK